MEDYLIGGFQVGLVGFACLCACCGAAAGAGTESGGAAAVPGGCGCCAICAMMVWWIVDCVLFGINDVLDGNGVGLAPW